MVSATSKSGKMTPALGSRQRLWHFVVSENCRQETLCIRQLWLFAFSMFKSRLMQTQETEGGIWDVQQQQCTTAIIRMWLGPLRLAMIRSWFKITRFQGQKKVVKGHGDPKALIRALSIGTDVYPFGIKLQPSLSTGHIHALLHSFIWLTMQAELMTHTFH